MTRFVFGLAGIPNEIYEEVERENKKYAEGAEFRIERMPNFVGYTQRNVDFFTKYFHDKVSKESGGALADVAFAIIYIKRDERSTNFFRDAFFPHMLMVPVEWELDLSRGSSGIRASKNELIPLLAEATKTARVSLRGLRHEVESNANSTPFLLPVLNFSSKLLVPTLQALHSDLALGNVMPRDAIAQRAAEFHRKHDFKYNDEANAKCYTDDEKIHFKPPGSDRHGFARSGGKHLERCLLSGRRRLGAPYDKCFHYDCTKGARGNTKANLHSCHDLKTCWEGNPNINVAPNDNVNVRGHDPK